MGRIVFLEDGCWVKKQPDGFWAYTTVGQPLGPIRRRARAIEAARSLNDLYSSPLTGAEVALQYEILRREYCR